MFQNAISSVADSFANVFVKENTVQEGKLVLA